MKNQPRSCGWCAQVLGRILLGLGLSGTPRYETAA